MTTASLPKDLQSHVSKARKMLIGNEWVHAASGETLDVFNPSTGQIIAQAAAGDAIDVDRAVRAAREALAGAWSKVTPIQRGRMLTKLADLIEQNIEVLAALDSLDAGLPIAFTRAVDLGFSIEILHYYAGWPTKSPAIPFRCRTRSTWAAALSMRIPDESP